MYAVITTGGKQYFVQQGEKLQVEKLELDPGATLNFEAMLVAETDGSQVQVGTPFVSGITVVAKVLEHGRADKISVIKYKPKVRYRRNVGHRQPFTLLQIESIGEAKKDKK
jgi:large subunit ribosomal protein L21